MVESSGVGMGAWALPLTALALVVAALLCLSVYRLITGGKRRKRIAERQRPDNGGEELKAAAEQVRAQCEEARRTMGPLLSADYSAGEQMGRILEALSETAELQEQVAGAARDFSEWTGERS